MDEHNGNDIRRTPKDRSDTGNTARDAVIVRTSVIGISVNLVLAAVKAAVGLGAGSIAVVLDAVNNLTDALSGVITILGAKLSGKEPDKKHPLGYGRIEYLSATLVAFLVLYAGVTALAESVKKMPIRRKKGRGGGFRVTAGLRSRRALRRGALGLRALLRRAAYVCRGVA